MMETQDVQQEQVSASSVTAFMPYLAEITRVNGEKLQLPRLTGKRIRATSKAVASLIKAVSKEMPEKFSVEANSPRLGADIVAMIFEILPTIMEYAVPVVSGYLQRPAEEIDEWDIEDISQVTVIFFLNLLKSGNTLLSSMGLSPRQFVNFASSQDQNPSIPSPQLTMPSSPVPDNSPSLSTPSESNIDGVQTQP